MTSITASAPNNQPSPIDLIKQQAINATKGFLELVSSLTEVKKCDRTTWRQLIINLGWGNLTARPYLKLSEFIQDIPIPNLLQLDINTLKALTHKKFTVIWQQLKESALSVTEVREQMSAIAKAIKEALPSKKLAKQIEYKLHQDGTVETILRVNENTGREIEKIYKESGVVGLDSFMLRLLQSFISRENIIEIEDVIQMPDSYREFEEEDFSENESQQLINKLNYNQFIRAKYKYSTCSTEQMQIEVANKEIMVIRKRLNELKVYI